MKIWDLAKPFVESYEPTIHYLNDYFQKYSVHYEYYFANHCKNKEGKIVRAIDRHPQHIGRITESAEKLPEIIMEIKSFYEKSYHIEFTQDVHLLVGLYGSNAYTYRQYNPEIAFCLEKLSPKTEHLQTIAAHEFGHAAHHLISMNEAIQWSNVDWTSPYTWLLQEGVATYLSTKAVQTREDVYFAFEEHMDWLNFCKHNEVEIIQKFIHDIESEGSSYVFKEWFSINGGQSFGHTRLAYYIAYRAVKQLIDENGEIPAFMLWNERGFHTKMRNELNTLIHQY
ncbi:hypothetical protein ACTHOQ_02430 [Solibacillus silvestris]|uniref:hypothetical protein n=1 Tax=Solibacillus silvestris TaxID=76853 RepID=UPI003F7EA92E